MVLKKIENSLRKTNCQFKMHYTWLLFRWLICIWTKTHVSKLYFYLSFFKMIVLNCLPMQKWFTKIWLVNCATLGFKNLFHLKSNVLLHTGNLNLKYVPVNRNGQSRLLKIHVVMAKVVKRGSLKTWRNVMAQELDGRINVPARLLYQTGPSSH